MKVTKQIIEHTAKLARMRLQEEEKKKLETELSGILDYVDQLRTVDTVSVEPTHQVSGVSDRTRQDIVTENYQRSQLLDQVQEEEDGLIKVQTIW